MGYRFKGGKPTLLLGEAKVSGEKKNPPSVVHDTDDSIYNNHKKCINVPKYLEQRLANYVKKVGSEHKPILAAILLSLSVGLHSNYDIVYGCCLVRDNECCTDEDYGKMKSEETGFLPGSVEFIIYSFDKKISQVVDLFYTKVEAA